MRRRVLAAVSLIAALLAIGQPAGAVPLPSADPFYAYTGSTPLTQIEPGTVLKTRSVTFHLVGLSTAVFSGSQLLYRTTDQRGRAAVTVASVIKPAVSAFPVPRLLSFQIAYDALDAKCDPSYFISGGVNLSGAVTLAEQNEIISYLTQGYTIVTADYEGEDLAWVAGQGEGRNTLDGIRAALASPAVGLPAATKVAMAGYSGGAIASEWAAELAPAYAPDVAARLVGTALGGIFVYPAHNLDYVDGTPLWSGVEPGALLGIARGFGIDLDKYASAYGKQVIGYTQDKCIPQLLGRYPGLTFAKLVQPRYATFTKVRDFVELNNKLIMGTGGTPNTPLLMVQGTGGDLDGTPGNQPGIGPGDGVMIAGDVRSLARTYCRRGLAVDYLEAAGLEHAAAIAPFLANAASWLAARFAGVSPPTNCSAIKPGNSVAPLPLPAPSSRGGSSSAPTTGARSPTRREAASVTQGSGSSVCRDRSADRAVAAVGPAAGGARQRGAVGSARAGSGAAACRPAASRAPATTASVLSSGG